MSKSQTLDELHPTPSSSGPRTKLNSFVARLSDISNRLGNDTQRDWLIGKLDDRLSELEDIAFVVEVPVGDNPCASQSTRKIATLDPVETAIARFESPKLREAVSDRCSESPNLLTTLVSEFIWEHLDNIARGESLKLLPLETLARIFSYIDVKERLKVLETISGGQGQKQGLRTQVNFRQAVLETYKSVTTIEDLGPKCSKLKLLQSTGGNWKELLQTRFPKLHFNFDGSVLQGFLTALYDETVEIVHMDGRSEAAKGWITVNTEDGIDSSLPWPLIVPIDDVSPSRMFIECASREVQWMNLIDMSVKNCASMLGEHMGGVAMFFEGFVYVVGGASPTTWEPNDDYDPYEPCANQCERYNPTTNSWERIADLNHERYSSKLFTWKDSLYTVGGKGSGGTVERYDPLTDTWAVVLTKSRLNNVIPSAVMVDDTLYYIAYDFDCDNYGYEIWKIDMRTDEDPEFCGSVTTLLRYASNYASFKDGYYSLYSRNGYVNIFFVSANLSDDESDDESDENERWRWLDWEVFVLDESKSTCWMADSGNVFYKGDRAWCQPLFM